MKLILILAFYLCAWASALELSFKPMVQNFAKNEVVLADLATCSGSKSKCQSLLASKIGQAPPPGLDRIYLAEMVIAPLQGKIDTITFAPSMNKCRLTRAQASLDSSALREELLQIAREKLSSSDSMDIQVRFNGYPSFSSPQQNWQFEWPSQIQSLSRIPVKVKVQDANLFSREIQVQVMVRRWSKVPVSSRDLKIGEVLTPADWNLKLVEDGPLKSAQLTVKQLNEKWEIARTIRAGQVLQLSQVRRPILVKSGENLTLFSQFGQGRIEMIAESMQNGSAGDLIKCKNSSTGKILLARLNETGEAEVEQ